MARAVYAKAAAVNFNGTVLDSNDLSVVRGSSQWLLAAAGDLAARFEAIDGCERLYASASEVMVRVRAPAPPPAKKGGWRNGPGIKKQVWLALLTSIGAEAERNGEAIAAVAERRYAESIPLKEQQRGFTPEKLAQAAEAAAAENAPLPAFDTVGTARRLGDVFDAWRREEPQRHFTFVMATLEADDADAALAEVFTRLRNALQRAQTEQLSVVLPPPVTTPRAAAEAFCAYTMGRQPATRMEDGAPISASAQARRREGREARRHLYRRQIEIGARAAEAIGDAAAKKLDERAQRLRQTPFRLARSFDEIVADPAPAGVPPNVRNKLAVVHLDGNAFGAGRARTLGRGFEAYRRLSLALERNAALLTAALLDWAEQNRTLAVLDVGPQPLLRLETLLFGGDEYTFVVPAWAGWSLVGAIQEAVAAFRAPWSGGAGEPVTYATGVVFAHYKSPIRELRRTASDLADAAKTDPAGSTDKPARSRSLVQVMALEGIDQAAIEVDRLRADLFGRAAADEPGAFSLDGTRWPEIGAVIGDAQRVVGRHQLHRRYREADHALAAGTFDRAKWLDATRRRLGQFDGGGELARRLFEDDALARGVERFPFLPLHQVVALGDYVEAGGGR